MVNPFFDHPILNFPYASACRHWEVDTAAQPTHRIIEKRRRAKFTEVYQIETDFKAKVESEFKPMVAKVTHP